MSTSTIASASSTNQRTGLGARRGQLLDLVEEEGRVGEVERGAEPVHDQARRTGGLPGVQRERSGCRRGPPRAPTVSGRDARRMTSIVDSRKAMATARSGPRASTLSRQAAAIQNSERRMRHSSRSSWTSISDSTALATIPASAALGRNASMSVKKSITTRDRPGRDQAGQLALRARGVHRRRAGGAVAGEQRAGEAGREVGRAVGEQHLVAVRLVAVLAAVAADDEQAFAQEDGHDRQGARQQPQVVGRRDGGQGQRRGARGDRAEHADALRREVEHRHDDRQQHQGHERPGDPRRIPLHQPDDQEGADARSPPSTGWRGGWTGRGR